MLCLAGTGLIGLVLMYIATPKIFFVGLLGMLGAYAYTGEPFVYKKRGLGAILSLVLMGPLMVLGAYVVFSENYSVLPILIALPAGLMIPLLMLSNELRDYHRDKNLGIVTLTVKLGFSTGKMIFLCLLIIAYSMTGMLVIKDHLPLLTLLVYFTLPIAYLAFKQVSRPNNSGIRITNILHISFNIITIVALLLG